ncbi:MAG: AAA family ATPase [Bacteroidales bacterium]|nr:AAA family ATPase [Bacteroidales bacterium]
MNIKSFSIEGLFNRFNHRIEFKNNINIIIGKNGVGKTTCLELLYALFNKKNEIIKDIPFRSMSIEFTDGKKWLITKENTEDPIWVEKKRKENEVKIIKSQRLVEYFVPYDTYDPDAVVPEAKVKSNTEKLAKLIKDVIAKAADITTNLDKTFPVRLLDNAGRNIRNTEYLKKNLADLETKRRELSKVGLIATEADASTPPTENISESSALVLSLYVQDSWAKLQPYETIAQKLSLFLEIINSRFLYKKMTIDKNKGYFFVSDEGEEIPIDKLSSGEQNELVMFYNLLFECNENNLILIDEPEISMHIEWLNNMVPDLLAISKLNGLSMLIATHSPDFIGEYWKLTTELK